MASSNYPKLLAWIAQERLLCAGGYKHINFPVIDALEAMARWECQKDHYDDTGNITGWDLGEDKAVVMPCPNCASIRAALEKLEDSL